MLKAPAHVTVSWAFLILIGIVFGYSYFFYPTTHPIECFIKQHTGKDCPTCGFSRAFSYYAHLKFTEGKRYNPLSWHVFIFFAFQFLSRILVISHYAFTKKRLARPLVLADIIISISGFLLAFLPILFKTLSYAE
ncbi:MAG: DUF2752 domain-containing protein [Bacteroidetes bacterium]|nr:DUF2752 domain-containing protein [Bacteroidota bacterium]